MQVSARLPLHGKYVSSSEYVEMRYIRFAGESASVAVLFALLELASKPHFAPLRNALKEILRQRANAKRVMELLTDPMISKVDVLLAWNSDIAAVKSAIRRMIEELGIREGQIQGREGELLGVQIDAFGNERPVVLRKYQIVIDFLPTEARILYKHYAQSSFTIMPTCHHIHLKFALFRRKNDATPRPLTREEACQYLNLLCWVNECQENIGEVVFDLGQATEKGSKSVNQIARVLSESGTFTELYPPRPKKEQCRNCHQSIEVYPCMGGCSLCLLCAVITLYSDMRCRCPICGNRFKSDALEEIWKIKDSCGFQLKAAMINECGICRLEKPIAAFARVYSLQHKCVICDTCIMDISQSDKLCRCRSCSELYSPHDQATITEWQRSERMESANRISMTKTCEKCTCEREEAQFQCFLAISHRCYVCDLCSYKAMRAGNSLTCPLCEVQFTREDFDIACLISTGQSVQTMNCQVCRDAVRFNEMQISRLLSHWWRCKACDECWRKWPLEENREICACCGGRLSSNDIERLLDFKSGHKSTAAQSVSVSSLPIILATTSDVPCPRCTPPPDSDLRSGYHLCRICGDSYTSDRFIASAWLRCGCFVCNSCIEKAKKRTKCKCCQRKYEPQEIEALNTIVPQKKGWPRLWSR